MNWNDLVEVSKNLKTMDIKGKEYVQVNERVKAFRKLFPMGNIKTEIVSYQDGVVVMKATAFDEDGKELATGHAYEKEANSFITKTNMVEVCETSCVGRCLGFINIGIDSSIASYEEVANAKASQETKYVTPAKIRDFELLYTKEEIAQVVEHYNVAHDGLLPAEVVARLIEKRKDNLKEAKKEFKEKCANTDLSGNGKDFF